MPTQEKKNDMGNIGQIFSLLFRKKHHFFIIFLLRLIFIKGLWILIFWSYNETSMFLTDPYRSYSFVCFPSLPTNG